uniref:NADH-ubiquinone oxidoreductase chain 6 n=1 Tax=Prioninae sp. MJTNT-2012 TaxID=1216942 RepID=U3KZS2_9CUCU|nr:NADH dehydrogenase subunit 6 [Prioninae sp. MJTNT-2012]
MTNNLILLSLCILTMNFLFMKHPLSFGLILLLQTILVALSTGMMNYNYWFSYMLFLIMVGGMLVLFIYMTSIASNEKFKFSSKIMMMTLGMLITSASLMIVDKFFLNTNMFMQDLIPQNMNSSNNFSMTKFFNWPSSMNLIMIMVYLLITLIMVVKITNIKYGPLRQKF